jgi:hypothetical protein
MLVLMASESAKKRSRLLGHAGVGAAVALGVVGVFFLVEASHVPFLSKREGTFHGVVALGSLLRTLQVVQSKAWQTASPTSGLRLRSIPLFVFTAYETLIYPHRHGGSKKF